MMLGEVCQEINNWFDKKRYFGEFVISDGVLQPGDFELLNGQYFRIIGSTFNDGVYQYPAEKLADETFSGAIWAMAVPPAVIAISNEIEDWVNKYTDAMNSPYQSESFGGYSYTKKSSSGFSGSDSSTTTWQGVFASRLNRWRKICPYLPR